MINIADSKLLIDTIKFQHHIVTTTKIKSFNRILIVVPTGHHIGPPKLGTRYDFV